MIMMRKVLDPLKV